jgi:hypothetical protein
MPIYEKVPGLRGIYAGKDGQIWSIRQGDLRQLPLRQNRFGELVFRAKHEGQRKSIYVSSTVLRTFLGPQPDDHRPAHRNNNMFDNTLSNLYYKRIGRNT